MKKNILFATLCALMLSGCGITQSTMTHIPRLERQGDIEVALGATPDPSDQGILKADATLAAAVTDHLAVQLTVTTSMADCFHNDYSLLAPINLPPFEEHYMAVRPAVGYLCRPTESLSMGFYVGAETGRHDVSHFYWYDSWGLGANRWDCHHTEYRLGFAQMDLSWQPRPWVELAGRLRLGYLTGHNWRTPGYGCVSQDNSVCDEAGMVSYGHSMLLVDPVLQASFGARNLKASLSLSFERTFMWENDAPVFGLGVSYRFNPLKR